MAYGEGVSEISLRETVADLKHDLGKYVAWRSVNYDDAAWEGPLTPEFADALRKDVLNTKGDHAAWDVFEHHTRALDEPWPAGLQQTKTAIDVLREHESALREGGPPLAEARPAIRRAQAAIRQSLRDLLRELSR